MKNLIKIVFIIILFAINKAAYSNKIEKIIFTLDNEIYTSIDVEKRKKYLLLNKERKELINKENLYFVNDLISILLFNKSFKEKKIIDENDFEKLINDQYNKYFININKKNISEKIIKENIKYDYQRKLILENILAGKKNDIFNKNLNLLKEIYEIKIEYYSLNFKNYEIINKLDKNINFDDLKQKILENKIEKIKFMLIEKEIKLNNNLNKKIKDLIKKNNKYFNIKIQNDNFIIGKFTKKIKIDQNLKFTLVQIKQSNNYKKSDYKCNKISEYEKDINLNIKISKNIDYFKLNNEIKNNLLTLEDRIIFKTKDSKRYIILCDIAYDEEKVKEININIKINQLVQIIEKEFTKEKSLEYKLIRNE